MQSVFLPAKAFGGPGKFGFNDDAAMTEAHALFTDQNRQKLFLEWSNYWDLSKAVLIEKSPPNIIRTRFLQALFPNAQFIVLMRHPIPVSYATMKWSKSGLSDLFRHWITVHSIFERDRSHLTNLCMVSYEQLVHDPESALARIGRFLNLYIQHTYPFSDHNKDYFSKWNSPGLLNSIQRARIIARFEGQFTPFGYSLRNTSLYPAFG